VPSPASDVWGLGVTLFETITGARPFPAAEKVGNFPQLEHRATPLRRLRPRAPRALEDLLAACLAPNPGDRPTLPVLLPKLNHLIPHPSKMWPEDLQVGDGAE
jgi:serine/threonine protein kinase